MASRKEKLKILESIQKTINETPRTVVQCPICNTIVLQANVYNKDKSAVCNLCQESTDGES